MVVYQACVIVLVNVSKRTKFEELSYRYTIIPTPLVFDVLVGGDPIVSSLRSLVSVLYSRFPNLSDGIVCVMTYLAIFVEQTPDCDKPTQTDSRTLAYHTTRYP